MKNYLAIFKYEYPHPIENDRARARINEILEPFSPFSFWKDIYLLKTEGSLENVRDTVKRDLEDYIHLLLVEITADPSNIHYQLGPSTEDKINDYLLGELGEGC